MVIYTLHYLNIIQGTHYKMMYAMPINLRQCYEIIIQNENYLAML